MVRWSVGQTARCTSPADSSLPNSSLRELERMPARANSCRWVRSPDGYNRQPFAQAAGFARLARLLRREGYEVAAYTGYTLEELLAGTPEQRELLAELDVLIDGPFLLSQRSLELNFRGSRNQRVLNVPESLRQGKAVPETSGRWLGEY